MVNAKDDTYKEWTEIGAKPFLSAIDFPANYISKANGLPSRDGIFDFDDSGPLENIETLTKVELEVYLGAVDDPDTGFPVLTAWVWDGVSYTAFTVPVDNYAWAWKSVDISSKINTWAKLDGCRVYLRVLCGAEASINADAMRLKATTVPPVVARHPIGNGLTWVSG